MVRSGSMNQIRVMDEHVAHRHFDRHFRIGRRIGQVALPAASTEHTGGFMRKDIEDLRAAQASDRAAVGPLLVERDRRRECTWRCIELVGVILMVGELVARVGRLVDVLDPIGLRFVAEKRPNQIEHQRGME